MEAGIASPTLSMPGAFWPSQSRRPVRLSLSTNQPSASPRPLSTLSTLSTDSAYYSPQDGSFSPVSAYPNRPFSAIDAENDPLHSDFMTLENLRRDVRTNLRLRPLSSQPRCHTPGTDSVDYTTAPNSPLSAPFSPSAFSAEPSIAPPQVLLENATPIRPSDTNIHFMPIEPSELASMLATSAESDTLIIDTRLPLNHSLLRIRGSINLAIPTLMLKRFRKAGSLSSLDILNPYIGESSRKNWDTKVAVRGKVRWPGDIIIIDEEMNSVDAHAARYGAANVGQNAPPNAASTLLCTLHPLCRGRVLFVQGGMAALRGLPEFKPYLIADSPSSNDVGAADDSPHVSVLLSYVSDEPATLQTVVSSSHAIPESSASTPRKEVHKRPSGLFSIKTEAGNTSRKSLPHLEPGPSSSASTSTSSSSPSQPSSAASSFEVLSWAPSPSPSCATFSRPHSSSFSNRSRRPTLGIDTASAEHLRSNFAAPPKLQLRTAPSKSATLPPCRLQVPKSPLRPDMDYIVRSPSTPSSRNHNDLFLHTPPSGASNGSTDDTSADVSAELHLPSRSRSRSPGFLNIPDGSDCRSRSRSPFSLPSPSTIRPPSPCSSKSSPCTPHSEPRGGPSEFSVSTILPNFLYLGPEISTVEQAQKLKAMGVKRILNMAIECEDGLGLEGMFEKYKKIPMRDHVEEDNIVKGMREVCHFLDDARLHSSPTFVHCKAGKSRSVTAVIAYLIHANHWDRDRAYNFISGRRKGISPNIGFMSELMNFEKEELCGKGFAAGRGNESPVAASTATDTGSGDSAESGSAPTAEHNVSEATVSRTGPQLRRLAHIRDSLPPKLYQNNSSSAVPGSAVDGLGTSLVDHAEETEVKDAEGRYRHARRAPVDEFTLQPMRRVSKAGLESASWN